MALLQQHDARRDIVIEPAARRRAAIEARGIPNCGHSELGAQSGCKNPPACYYYYCYHYFLPSDDPEGFQKLHPLQKSYKIITGNIARSATRQYLSYSEADFEVFRHAGATRCTDGGEIWHRGWDLCPLVPFFVRNFTPSVQCVAPAWRKTSKSASE